MNMFLTLLAGSAIGLGIYLAIKVGQVEEKTFVKAELKYMKIMEVYKHPFPRIQVRENDDDTPDMYHEIVVSEEHADDLLNGRISMKEKIIIRIDRLSKDSVEYKLFRLPG